MALELGNVSAAVAAERAILANLELRGKLNGQFVQRHEVTRLSVLLSPDWGRIRQVFSNTFAQFPEAKPASLAFAAALHAMETDAAKEITERKTPLVLEHEATA
jgi:hypothetical protein